MKIRITRGALVAAMILVTTAIAVDAQRLPFPLSAPSGFRVELVSTRIPGARFIAVAPNGDVIVSLISQGSVVAVHPGAPVDREPTLVAGGLQAPNGVAFRGNDLYIATWTGVRVLRDYPAGAARIETLFDNMPRNGDHNARAIAIAADGTLFVSSGSDCNICAEQDPRLATILRYNADGSGGSVYARGLRNASGLAFDAEGQLWAVVNQRDNLAPDHTNLPPDELDLVRPDGDYGWPTCYPDGNARLPNPEFPGASCAGFPPTTFNLPAHSAPLQTAFYEGSMFPARYRGALFIAFHGSWNRNPPTGYKVVSVFFQDGQPVAIRDFVTGWIDSAYRVMGRPVGVAVAHDGSLYVSDDRGYLFRVSYTR